METLLLGAVVVLIVLLGIFLIERKVLLNELESTENELSKSREDYRNEKNKYQRKLYAFNVIKCKINLIATLIPYDTKKHTIAKISELTK